MQNTGSTSGILYAEKQSGYGQQLLGNIFNLKLKQWVTGMIQIWNNEVTSILLICLNNNNNNKDNCYFPRSKYWKYIYLYIFLELFSDRRCHLLKFLSFVDSYYYTICTSKDCASRDWIRTVRKTLKGCPTKKVEYTALLLVLQSKIHVHAGLCAT